MAEELKHLIEQIQKEGVEKAEKKANTLIFQAKEKAATIVKEAERKAYEAVLKAKTEADAFAERSVKTLEQAARDLLITVGQGCEKVVTETLGKKVDSALAGDLLERTILTVVGKNPDHAAELSVSDADKTALIGFCAEAATKSGQAIELKSDSEVLSGFKVSFKGQNVYLDVTGESVAEALASFLRPELAKTVSGIAREQLSNA